MTFKNMKFKVETPAQSAAIQKALFELGYVWAGEKTKVVEKIEQPVLLSCDDGYIRYSSFPQDINKIDEYKTMSLKDITEKQDSTETNPKAAIGAKSIPMTMLSPLAIAMGSLGKYNGKLKYGGANYIGTEVVASVYIDAIIRHALKYLMGERVDEVDGVPHLGAN